MTEAINILLTQCPHCDTVFRVSGDQLYIAQGRVRCGQCRGVFDAHAHPYETSHEAAPDPIVSSGTQAGTEDTDDAPYITATRDHDDWSPEAPDELDGGGNTGSSGDNKNPINRGAVTASQETVLRVDAEDVLRAQLNEEAQAFPAPRQTGKWTLSALVLLIVLGMQYVYFARATLAQYAPVRPWLQRACVYLGCDLPLRHAPERIELLSRDVISHPRIPEALLINATFVNRADFVQAYPVLQIALSRDGGTVSAMRRFQPEEYLAPGVSIATGLPPGVPVHVVLEVVEPKQHATSFQFDFL